MKTKKKHKYEITPKEKQRRKRYWAMYRKRHKAFKGWLKSQTKQNKRWYFFVKKRKALAFKYGVKERFFPVKSEHFVKQAKGENLLLMPLWQNRKKWGTLVFWGLLFQKLGYFPRLQLLKLRHKEKNPKVQQKLFLAYYNSYLRFTKNRLYFRATKRLKKYFKKVIVKTRKKYKKNYFKYRRFSFLTSLKGFNRIKSPRLDTLQPYRITIKRIENNVFVYLSHVATGNILYAQTAGSVGYKGAKKTAHITAEKVVNQVAKECLARDIHRLDLVIHSAFVDKYVKTAVSGLTQAFKLVKLQSSNKRKKSKMQSPVKKVFLKIKHILLAVSASHNGMRKPKQRRV